MCSKWTTQAATVKHICRKIGKETDRTAKNLCWWRAEKEATNECAIECHKTDSPKSAELTQRKWKHFSPRVDEWCQKCVQMKLSCWIVLCRPLNWCEWWKLCGYSRQNNKINFIMTTAHYSKHHPATPSLDPVPPRRASKWNRTRRFRSWRKPSP